MDIYFSCVFLAYLIGSALFVRAALQGARKPPQIAWVLTLWVCGSLLGAKLFHVLFEAQGHLTPEGYLTQGIQDLLRADPWHGLRFNDPGYVLYGGLLGALVLGWKYRDYADYATKGLALGLCVGRLGCFYAGCCYGIADLPVQLFEAAFALWLLWRVECFRDILWFYALWRFGIEFVRADTSRGIWALGLSTSQWISIGILGVLGWTRLTSTLKSSQMRSTRIRI